MIKSTIILGLVAVLVAAIAIIILEHRIPIGPVIFALGLVPIAGLVIVKRSLVGAVPDMIFGAIDTGLLVIPTLLGGMAFGVAGAIAGGVVGDALTDAITGFFEGGVAEWLRGKGIEESREALTSSLGKMSGCLLGAGVVLSLALAAGIRPDFL